MDGDWLLGNRDHCALLARQLDGLGVLWEVRKATRKLQSRLPAKPGIYMFVCHPLFRAQCADGTAERFPRVLYVGHAGGERGSRNTLRQRYAEYARYLPDAGWAKQDEGQSRERLLRAWFKHEDLQFWFSPVADAGLLEDIETQLVELFEPPGNVRPGRKPRLRVRQTAPAF